MEVQLNAECWGVIKLPFLINHEGDCIDPFKTQSKLWSYRQVHATNQ